MTGSSVFDFQGDGIAEVVYNDECFLHVYDGRDGTELLMEPIPNSSRTGYEYPIVVADVPVDTDLSFEVRVDPPTGGGTDPGAVEECDEADNVATATERCPGLL